MSSPQETTQYKKRPILAFREGHYARMKVKRHYHQKYDRYHYYLPERLVPVIQFLQKYFRVLDNLSEVKKEDRFRQTEFEFSEIAIMVMHHIRCRMVNCKPIVAGSAHLSPCPWAVFGPGLGTQKLVRHQFTIVRDIFQHYDKYIWGGGFNVAKIERPLGMKPDEDGLALLSEIYDRSANFILAVSLLLLCDLIKNCGPDSGEFRPLFTNDKKCKEVDPILWQIALAKVIPPDLDRLRAKVICLRSNNTQSYTGPFYKTSATRKPAYFDVEIRDSFLSSHFNLTQGENVEYHGEFCSSQQSQNVERLLLPYYGDPDLSLQDIDEDEDEEARLNREYKEVVATGWV